MPNAPLKLVQMKGLFSIFFSLLILMGLHPFATSAFAQNNTPKPGACGTGGMGGGKNPVPLNGSHALGMTYNQSGCGLNYVEAHEIVETRYNSFALPANQGTGLPVTLPITGLPNCHTVLQAYLWYNVSYQSASPPATTVNITNPAAVASSVPATNIGTDQDKCWSETGTVNYRADVTAAISGNGNYVVNITGLSNPNWEVDGVEFIIIYKDNSATYQGSFVIWDGAITNQGSAATATMSGINACAAGVNAKAFIVLSDMQDNTNGNQHPATLNGVTANYPNNFWCVDQTNTTVTSGQATATFGTNGLGMDCYDWSIMGLYYQTTTCTTCVPAAVSVTVTPTPASCGASNGSAVASASGAPAPYTYSWSTGATSTSVSNLAGGSYSVTVTDATGCSVSQTFTITNSIGPAVTFTTTPALCNGGSTGTATANASGGTAPYTFGWAITPVQTTPTASGLAAGTYSVVVSDASGCSATYSVAVTEPTALTATTTVIDATCFGNSDGSATAGPSGGTGTYSYSWTPSGQNTQTASGLAAGNYSVTVTDANGCTVEVSCTINQSAAVTSTATVVNNASCFGSTDGSAISNASGGLAPYSYAWSPTGQNTQTATGFPAGTYSVTVTDANGCKDIQSVTITEPSAMLLPITSTLASCGTSDGTATVNPSGGVGPYTYLWLTTPAVQVTQTAVSLASGTYSVIVTDANGCFQSQSVVVAGGVPPVADFTFSPEIISLENPTVDFTDASTGVVSIWNWSFGDPISGAKDSSILQNPTHVYSDTGVYCITLIVYDTSGLCSDTAVKCLKVEPQSTFYVPNTFTPNKDGKNEIFFAYGTYLADFKMYIFDRWGNLIFESNDIYKGWDGSVDNNGDTVQEDVYVWKIKYADSMGAEHNHIGHVTIVR